MKISGLSLCAQLALLALASATDTQVCLHPRHACRAASALRESPYQILRDVRRGLDSIVSTSFSQGTQNVVDKLNPIQQIDNLCECRFPHTGPELPSSAFTSQALPVISFLYSQGCFQPPL